MMFGCKAHGGRFYGWVCAKCYQPYKGAMKCKKKYATASGCPVGTKPIYVNNEFHAGASGFRRP
jgi:hypothetical protein